MQIYINHIGFLCHATKWFIMPYSEGLTTFEVQDMGISASESLGEYEDWATVYRGELQLSRTDMGTHYIGDFTALTTPGVYRVVVKEVDARSYQFVIADGAFSKLPRYFLDFVHDRRSGNFNDDLRRQSHLDDALRSDNGQYIDVSGGWYDAGDLRKWMTMSNLPAIAFADMYNHAHFVWNHYASESVSNNDWVTETTWVVPYLLKMQDEAGFYYEGVGLGGAARRQSHMTWWYENHSGCYGDNSDNRFTDNQLCSGDERYVRVEYNPMVQYITQYILLRTRGLVSSVSPQLAEDAVASAYKSWQYTLTAPADKEGACYLTATLAWRLLAMQELCKCGKVEQESLDICVAEFLELQNKTEGFWYYDTKRETPYRGVQHSAQPLIALCRYCLDFPEAALMAQAKESIQLHISHYVKPLSRTNPFAIIPYGCWFKPATQGDYYRTYQHGLYYRFYMPDCSEQKVNHGLSGHWTSWAHALSLAYNLLNDKKLETLAWAQLYWLLGGNEASISLVSGIGYNNPMPHSRFHGTMVGGFCVGPRGDKEDRMVIDSQRRAEWNSTEYWNCPVANTLMAFAQLLPTTIEDKNKL